MPPCLIENLPRDNRRVYILSDSR